MEHVLARVTKKDVKADPFPHIVIEDAIDSELCAKLTTQYPTLDVTTKGKLGESNKRFSFCARDVRESAEISSLWKAFIEKHTSQEFLNTFVGLFEEHIVKAYPDFERRFGESAMLCAGVRNVDDYQHADVLLDAQICVNTPVMRESSSVKIAHIDDADKLFAGLFYLRHPDDDSRGGELELYRYRSEKKKFHGPRLIDAKYVEVVKRVPYKANTLVMFLNSLDALHGVALRAPTHYPRHFMNLVGEVREPLFDLVPYTEGRVGRTLRRAGL